MKTSTSTAVALLLGLGLALPAAAQQQTGAETPVPDQGVPEQSPEARAAEEIAAGADADADQYVTGEEAAAYHQRRFGEITGGTERMTQEQFTGAMTEAEEIGTLAAEVDQDGDGFITPDEWMAWHEQRFATVTEGTEGRMAAQDYERFASGAAAPSGVQAGESGLQGGTPPQQQEGQSQ